MVLGNDDLAFNGGVYFDERSFFQDPVATGIVALFRPGYIGAIGTGGYYRSRTAPCLEMISSSDVNRNVIVNMD